MLNIKKAITVSEILIHNLISLSLFLALFCFSGHLHAQTPPALDFPPGIELDPRHLGVLGEKGLVPSAISENVEFVGATGGAVYDVFVFASLNSLLRKPPGELRLSLRLRRPCNPRHQLAR